MARQSKKSKASGNELDMILDQLKKSYGSESSDDFEDMNEATNEEDYELNEILEKIFSEDAPPKSTPAVDSSKKEPAKYRRKKSAVKAKTSAVSEQEILPSSGFNSDTSLSPEEPPIMSQADSQETLSQKEGQSDMVEVSASNDQSVADIQASAESNNGSWEQTMNSSEEASAEALEEAIAEDQSIEDLSESSIEKEQAQQEVDSILDLMFPNKKEAEALSPSEITPHTAQNPEIIATEESLYQMDSTIDTEIELLQDIESKSDECFEEEIMSDIALLSSVDIDDLADENGSSDTDEQFAVCDEEYSTADDEESIDNTTDSQSTKNPIITIIDDDSESDSNKPEATKNAPEISSDETITTAVAENVILTPDKYVHDPLQATLPSFKKQVAKEQSSVIPAPGKSLNEHVKTSNDPEVFNNNDISLLLKFGYNDEVRTQFGEEKAQQAILETENRFDADPYNRPFGYCGKEFADRSQIKAIRSRYRSDKRSLIVKLAFVSAITLLIIALNTFFEFFSDRTSYPIILTLEFLLIVLIGVILYKKIIAGVLSIIRFESNKYSLLCFVLFVYCIYSFVTVIMYAITYPAVNVSEFMMFGPCVAIYAILSVISDIIDCIKETNTFDILASSESLFTLEKQAPSASISTEDKKRTKHGSHSADTYAIRKASLVSGYFKKTANKDTNITNLIYMLGVVPVISLVIGCACSLVSGSIMLGASSMMLTCLLCIPFSFVFLSSITESIIAKRLNEKKTAFIGKESVNQYAQADTLIFQDKDAIEITSHTEIQPNKGVDIKKSLSIAHEVFTALNGPLSSVSSTEKSVQNKERSKQDLVINDISDNGIDIYFNSSMNILMGDKHYMLAHNIKVKTDTNLNAATKGMDCSVIYMAFDGIPKLGFIINSKIKPDFTRITERLDKDSIKVLVETYEPQINDLYFEQNRSQNSAIIGVFKPPEFESSECKQICDGGIISANDSFSVAEAVLLSRKIIDQRKCNKRHHVILSAIGVLFACILTVILNMSESIYIFGTLKAHISLLFNIIMIGGLILGFIRLLIMGRKKL